MKKAPPITIEAEQRAVLETWARGRRTPVRLMERARIVLAAARGLQNKDISQELGMPPNKVGRWRRRFAADGLDGIRKDRPRRTCQANPELTQRIIETTTQTTPPGRTHWGSRGLAKHLGTSPSTVQRVWRAAGLKPHLTRTFKLSNDPAFAEKLVDVVGLYLNPPEKALVLSVDEKSQIQALDRTQPSLPMYKGRGGTLTHDYKRNGTTTLFAALNVASGKVIGKCLPRHRHQEYLSFLKLIDRSTPAAITRTIAIPHVTPKQTKSMRCAQRPAGSTVAVFVCDIP